jgi:hypothetical protein
MSLDAAHIHLMLNHLPVIAAPLLLLLFTIGLLRGSGELVSLSLVLAIGLALATGIVYLTGEPAEELVERAPWFRESLLETHEDQALAAMVAAVATGVLAAVALWMRRRPGSGAWLTRAVWAGLALSTLMLGWTALSGGRIRHDEIRAATVDRPPAAGGASAQDAD